MSYILDALKRAEQDRQVGQMPNVAAPVADDYYDEPRRWPWILLLLALLAAAGAAGAYWLASQQRTSVTSAGTEERPVLQVAPSRSVSSESAALQSYQTESDQLPTRVTAVTTRPQLLPVVDADTADEPQIEEVQPEVAASAVDPQSLASAPVKQAKAEPKPEINSEPKPAPQPVLEPVAQSAAETATSPQVDEANSHHSLPWLKEMSSSFRRSVPSLDIQFHRYSENASRSFVMIDGVRYRQGQILKSGPTVEDIVEEGLVLRWQGERFVYPTGG